ncbi:MAG: serine/threonine protein kinase [Clostridiales bacterium]|nr:serine/threonine protein kinase [Clostridiales bacterium]
MQQEIWFDKYRIIKLLGSGGTAEVYLAEHIKLHSFRAIKYISKHHPLYKSQLKEAQILKELKHSCIPIIYDIEEDEDGSYIIEQYLEGISLRDYVLRSNPLHKYIIIQFALQICDLIKYLHSAKRPVLYLDLQPQNIIVTDSTLKLIDFGSAMFCDEVDENVDYYGTKGYAAPELYSRNKADERSDIYGIGMLLYFMVSGHDIRTDMVKMDHIDFKKCPKRLKAIIIQCLRYNPSQRYSSVSQLEKHLSAIMKKRTHLLKPGSSIEIGIAGAQSRIGTTHLSFRLCRYFNDKKISCIYVEENKSRCIRQIQNRYFGLNKNQDIIQINGIPMAEMDLARDRDVSGFNIVVKDYGCLDRENKAEFFRSHYKILVLGAKDWELRKSEELLDMVSEYKDVIYLFNYLDGKQFQQVIKNMDNKNCMRIPYEPNPFIKPKDKISKEFFRELLGMFKELDL